MSNIEKEFTVLLYHMEDSDASIQAIIKDGTFCVTQKAMAELFDVSVSTISRHLKNIFEEGELDEKVVVAFFANTTSDDKKITASDSTRLL